jgi:hypothetical protein
VPTKATFNFSLGEVEAAAERLVHTPAIKADATPLLVCRRKCRRFEMLLIGDFPACVVAE